MRYSIVSFFIILNIFNINFSFAQVPVFPPSHSCFGFAAPSELRVLNLGGGLQADGSDGLEFITNNRGQIQINAYGTKGQIFSPNACVTGYGIALAIDNGATITVYEPSNMTPVSQSNVTGFGSIADPYSVTTVFSAGAGGPEITRIDTYIYPQQYIGTQIKLNNINDTYTYKLFYYVDSYLAGGDSGIGYSNGVLSNGNPAIVGVTKNVSGIERLMGFRAAGVPWDRYASEHYFTVRNSVISAPYNLSNNIDTNMVDNGFGVQWTVTGQSSFDTGQINGTFSNSLLEQTLLFTPSQADINQVVDLAITMNNLGLDPVTNNYYVDLIEGLALDRSAAVTTSNCTFNLVPADIVESVVGGTATRLTFPHAIFAASTSCVVNVKIKVLPNFIGNTQAASGLNGFAPLALRSAADGLVSIPVLPHFVTLFLIAMMALTAAIFRKPLRYFK